MNTILRTATRFSGLRTIFTTVRQVVPQANQQRQLARSLWYMSSVKSRNNDCLSVNQSKLCSCGCGGRGVHSKAERELVEFLTEEILEERKAQKVETIPSELDGFKAKLDGAEVTLTKTVNDETIKIVFNVNHTVDTDSEPEMHPNMEKADIGELKSKPNFTIDLIRGNTTFSVICSFSTPSDQDDYNDVFEIDELSVYCGEWNEKIYAVGGDVIDSYLYDLVMNYLEEKGISNRFVEKLSEYSTAYEHSAYISLLEGLSKFASGK